ncbi:MAG: cyanophycin synthetase, partial [Bacteroidota bacterium]|nr:cyanophycin synthetase [Bacteroidota bacterium]
EDHNSDIHISDISANPYASLKWNHINKPKNNLIKSNLIGRYNYSNIMAAVGFGILFGVPDENINAAINNYTPKNMRSQYLSTESNKLLIDAYNANPTSMKAALQNFDVMNAAAKCMILGEMMELGIWAEQEHEILVEQINKMNIKEVFLVGDIFKTLSDTLLPSYKVFSTTKELSSYLEKNPLSNKTILLKGSRGNKLESLIEKL